MDFQLSIPGRTRSAPEQVVGLIPAEAISALRATRAGTYLTEVSLPGSLYGNLNDYNGTHWALAMGQPVQFAAEDPITDPVLGVDLNASPEILHAQLRALATAAATAAVYMSRTPRESVQVELVSSLYTPDQPDLNVSFPIVTPFVTVTRDPAHAIEPDLTRPQATEFLASELRRLLREKISRYGKREGWFAAIDSVIVRRQTAPRVGRGGANLIGRSLELGSRVWVAFNPRTTNQCLFQALCVSRSFARAPKRGRDGTLIPYRFKDMFSHSRSAQALWQNSTSSFRDGLKRRCQETGHYWEGDAYAGFETIQVFSDAYQIVVKVYSSALILKSTFTPNPDSPLKMQRCPRLPPKMDCVELMFTGSHYMVLLRRRSLTAVFSDAWEEEAADVQNSAIKFLDSTSDGLRPYAVNPDPDTAKLPATFMRLDDELPLSRPLKVPLYTVAARYQTADTQALKMLAWDTETYPAGGRCVLYATGLAWFDLDDTTGELVARHKIWRGEDSTCDMLVWLGSGEVLSFERLCGCFLIAHNGAKFDVAMIATSIALSDRQPWSLDTRSFVENNSRWISGKITMKQRYINAAGTEKVRRISIILRDSYCLLPGALKRLAADMNVGGSQKLDLPHDRIFGGGDPGPLKPDDISTCPLHWTWLWGDDWDGQGTPGVYTYLKADCITLLEIMRKFNASIFSAFKFGALQCPTAASISKRIFLSSFYRGTDMHVCCDELERIIRAGFLGGRVECFRQGLVEGDVYYYDFTSLYPGVGRQDLPRGAPTVVDTADWRTASGFGFYVVDVYTDTDIVKQHPHYLPFHPIIANSRLVFPWISKDRPVRMCLFQPAMKLCEDLMPGVYVYDIKFAILFKRKPYMKDFFEEMVKKKAEARAKNQSSLEAAAKIVANSGYGWTGLRWSCVDGVAITEGDDDTILEKCLAERRLLASARFGRYTVIRRRDTMDNSQTAIQVASAISCYGRMELFKLMFDVRLHGGEVYYCDTDSIMCNMRLKDVPSLLYKYVPDHATPTPGAALQSLKNELDSDLVKRKLLPKGALHDLPFSRLYLLGAKFYCLEFDRDDMYHTVMKAKGYKATKDQPLDVAQYKQMSSHLDELENVFGGVGSGVDREEALRLGALANRQLQMPFSKTVMLDTYDCQLQQMGWAVRHQITHRLFKPCYSKAYVDKETRVISPFLLTSRGLEGNKGYIAELKELVNN